MSSIFDTFGDDEEAPARAGPAVSVPERPAPAAPTTAPKKGGSIFDTFGDDEGDAPVATPATPKEDWWEEWKRKQNEAGTGHEPAPAPVTPTPAQPTPAAPKPVDSGDTGDWWEDWKRKQNEAGTPKEEAKPIAAPPIPAAGVPPALTGPQSDKQIPERKDNTWEDYLHAARSGTGGVISAVGGFIDYSFPETPWHTRVGETVRSYGRDAARWARSTNRRLDAAPPCETGSRESRVCGERRTAGAAALSCEPGRSLCRLSVQIFCGKRAGPP